FPWRKGTGGLVFFGEIFGEGFLSSCAIAFAAACADFNLDVKDGPRWLAALAASEVETRTLAGVGHAHLSNISAMSASVTRSLPATLVGRKRPLRISVRSDAAVRGPLGKNFSIACLSEYRGSSLTNLPASAGMAASLHMSAPAFSADGSSIWAMHASGSRVSPSASKTVPSGVCLMAPPPSPAFVSGLTVRPTEGRRGLALAAGLPPPLVVCLQRLQDQPDGPLSQRVRTGLATYDRCPPA